jgi:predicted  nucleic acid-binding Zn-ribbon protein
LQNFRCPRCGEKFGSSGFYHNVFARKCLNCGLPKYSS